MFTDIILFFRQIKQVSTEDGSFLKAFFDTVYRFDVKLFLNNSLSIFSQKIKATADREKIEIIAEAEKQSNILKGEGEAARNQILNEAFAKDPEFFEFIRSMEAYADTFKDGTTTMVISPDSDFFEYFENSEGAN